MNKLLLILLPILIGVFFLTKPKHQDIEINGTYFEKPQYIMPFALTQSNGSPFTDQDFTGQWSLIFFGFTYCPDICPTTLALLNNVVQELDQQYPGIKKPQIIFISIDPERDNLAQLDKYVHYFNPDFIAVTGDPTQLKTFARQLGVIFDKVMTDPQYPDQYLMEHSTSMALINPQRGIQAFFTSPHEINSLVGDIAGVIKHQSD